MLNNDNIPLNGLTRYYFKYFNKNTYLPYPFKHTSRNSKNIDLNIILMKSYLNLT